MTSPPSASESRTSVLLVEDDPAIRRSLQLHLRARRFDVRAFGACRPVLADGAAGEAAVLVSEYKLPDGDGLGLLTALRAKDWRGVAILLTSETTRDLEEAARSAGYARVLRKPIIEAALGDMIERLLRDGAGA
ncbi:response regulator [Caulobacter segnis]|jgi:DNA-binding response OmpR family regulator|uniref:response regulator n=1 Tax=Caulobacter segnis TaxID=88688 RepID=UPI001CBBB419|nr:response regulator [Caulobacter segnis]UAL09177.1 response regulator [Caulobacter segnis]